MPVHDGHRERLRERFLEYGLESFNDINALELLLFFCIPRRDTNVIAHNLIDRFKDLRGVLSAEYSELMEVEGIGAKSAMLISLVSQISKKAEKVNAQGESINTPEAMYKYFKPYFSYLNEEQVYLLMLDSQLHIINCKLMSSGSVNSVLLDTRVVAETALKYKATAVALAHNHPDGQAMPSAEDIDLTARLKAALNTLGITFIDHIIVTDDGFYSFANSGTL